MDAIEDKKNRLILLTGGIASGKTFASDYLQSKGAVVIDTDLISRSMTRRDNAAGIAALAEIKDSFGAGLLTQEGDLDRGKMRALVFNDAAAKKRLEAILHGRIYAEVKRQIVALEPDQYGVVVVPILYVGSPYLELCGEVVVIEVPYEMQLQRLMARDSIDQEMAQKMIRSQISRLDRRQLGDYIIVSQNREFVERQLDKLHDSYTKRPSPTAFH